MIPLWLKLAYTAMVVVVVVPYWFRYRPGNFLWFSDIALLALVPALWLEDRTIASMMAVGVLLPETVWNVSYFGRLLTGVRLTSLTDYMFESHRPRWLRALSYFHVVLPPLMLWLLWTLGYDADAWIGQTVLGWAVLLLAYLFTEPSENVHWVHGWGAKAVRRTPGLVHLGIVMLGFPLVVFLPTHLLLTLLFG